MKLYHYVTKGSDVLKTGLFSFSKSPNVDLNFYAPSFQYVTGLSGSGKTSLLNLISTV